MIDRQPQTHCRRTGLCALKTRPRVTAWVGPYGYLALAINPPAVQTFYEPLLQEQVPSLMQTVTAAGSGTDPKLDHLVITSPSAWFLRQDTIKPGLAVPYERCPFQ